MKNSKGSIAQVSLEKDTEKFKNDRVLEGSVFRFKQIFHCYSKTIESNTILILLKY